MDKKTKRTLSVCQFSYSLSYLVRKKSVHFKGKERKYTVDYETKLNYQHVSCFHFKGFPRNFLFLPPPQLRWGFQPGYFLWELHWFQRFWVTVVHTVLLPDVVFYGCRHIYQGCSTFFCRQLFPFCSCLLLIIS